MLQLFLSIQLYTNGIAQITIPPTKPNHTYVVATSTNLITWDDIDSPLFLGSTNNQYYYANTLNQPQMFFRLEDLDASL